MNNDSTLTKASMELDINKGDILLGGRFKNKRVIVKDIGTDDLGQPTINGKKLLNFRIEKQLPEDKKSSKTRELNKEAEELTMTDTYKMGYMQGYMTKLAGDPAWDVTGPQGAITTVPAYNKPIPKVQPKPKPVKMVPEPKLAQKYDPKTIKTQKWMDFVTNPANKGKDLAELVKRFHKK